MNKIIDRPNFHKKDPPVYPCIYKTPPKVSINADIAEIKGHGLGSTK
jgi:hypothetical protein